MIKFNKKGFSTSILELSMITIIMGFLLMSIYLLSTNSYKKYNSFRIKNFVLEENTKILKAVSGIRFGEKLDYIDESPTNHPKLSSIIVSFPNEKTIEFKPDDLGADTNDITFINIEKNPIYVYNKDVIEIKEFKVIQLDETVHRGGVRIHMIVGASGKTNPLTARMFGNSEFYLDYYITYTFRNTPQEE